jgi:plastocyanin
MIIKIFTNKLGLFIKKLKTLKIMVNKLPFILFLMCAIGIVAQTTETVEINWDFGSNPNASGAANASRTVEIGDTVKWVWLSNNHNVVSNGDANENFNSGAPENAGATFSYTFTSLGTSDYVCEPHPGNMYGTITVVADGDLSTSESKRLKFEMFPNPASNKVSIQLPSGAEKATVEFYDSLGRLALSKKVTRINNQMDVNTLSKGIYILKVFTADQIGSQKFIKN